MSDRLIEIDDPRPDQPAHRVAEAAGFDVVRKGGKTYAQVGGDDGEATVRAAFRVDMSHLGREDGGNFNPASRQRPDGARLRTGAHE